MGNLNSKSFKAYLLKILLGRLVYLLIQPALFFFVHSDRAYVVFFDAKSREVLLVKNWLSWRAWSLPGGGLCPGEKHLEAAIREIQEEVNLNLKPQTLEQLCILEGANRFQRGRRIYYLCYLTKRTITHNQRELLAAQWYPLNKPPRTNMQIPVVLNHLKDMQKDQEARLASSSF